MDTCHLAQTTVGFLISGRELTERTTAPSHAASILKVKLSLSQKINHDSGAIWNNRPLRHNTDFFNGELQETVKGRGWL